MSVNITVNGKFTKSCLRHNLLQDPEQIRKETENERRKMRIQQVRAQSKNMAKKVRNDIEMEKERQLKKIEEVKARETEMWRQNVLAQQEKDYRSAIFQVGTAHRAAKAENIKQAQKKPLEQPRKLLKRPKTVTIVSNVGKENIRKNANVQTDITGKCYSKPTKVIDHRDSFVAPNEKTTEATEEYSSEGEEENSICTTTEFTTSVTQTSTSSLSDSVTLTTTDLSKEEAAKQRKSIKQLQKTAPVIMEVQTESDTSLINTPNIEDHHKQSNMHFSQVVSKKIPAQQASKTMNKRHEFKSMTEVLLTAPSTSAAAKKRFTQISDIIRSQKSTDEAQKQSKEVKGITREQSSPRKSTSKSPQQSGSSQVHKSPSKPIMKSPTASRPVSTQTTATLASKSISSMPSQRSTARVQFYDYNNKFHKQYEQPLSAVEFHEPEVNNSQLNAMEQAKLAEKFREARDEEMVKLRQKSNERCQKAIEREQVRRACEDLTAKLDALTKQREVLPPDNYQFSSIRLGQIAAQKETKLNNAVEDILRRPAVITCPVVNHQQSQDSLPDDIPRPHRYSLNLGSAFTNNEIDNLNSSDSCCSILLGYVNGQSKQITDDIKKYNKENGDTEKVKAEKLQNLLTRINRLRESLLDELEKCSTHATDKERVQSMMDSITEFRRERENILIDDNTKVSISKRENDLKKKEAILENKLREFYEIQKAAKKKNKSKYTENVLDNERNKIKVPQTVENGEEESEETQEVGSQELESEGMSSRSSMPHKVLSEEEQRENVQSEMYKKNHRDVQSETKKKENVMCEEIRRKKEQRRAKKHMPQLQESDERLLSSGEESEEIFVERRQFARNEQPVEIIIRVKNDMKLNKIKKIPPKSPRRLSTLIQSPTLKKNRRKTTTVRSSDSSSTSYRSLPPTIHNNVDQLLKNVPKSANSETAAEKDTNNLKRQSSNLNPLLAHYVQRLLGMSRTSINALGVTSSDVDTPSNSIINTTANLSAAEIEKSATNRLQHVQKFIEDNYSFIDELEESLRQSNSTDPSLKAVEVIWNKSLQDQKRKKEATKQIPHTENKPKQAQTLKKPSKTQKLRQCQEKPQIALRNGSTQLTENCTQRIAELTEMINKVRQEKQKLLETTLSSVSENERNSTEYLDLPDRRNNSGESTSKILDSQLMKSDENISTQSFETATQLEKNKLTGMSRDSGIFLSRPVTVQESHESLTEDLRPDQSPTEYLSLQFKKPKPPISITRYSPQLIEDIPHELSTIFEVETPGTSRINTSVHANHVQEAPQLQDEPAVKINYRKFPTFEEYARLNQLDMSQFDPEFSMQFEKEFNEFINLAREGKINGYDEFTSFSKYFAKSSSGDDREAAEELLASLKLANLSFKKFPTRKEYLDKMGVSTSDLLDSQSLDKTEGSRNINSSSTESLMNIEEELKLRKILTKSFRQNALGDRPNSISTSTSLHQHQCEISGIKQFNTGSTSSDGQSDNFEYDLKQLGIKWPSVMKKKTIETQALSSSTSSSFGPPSATPRRKPLKRCQTIEASFQMETQASYETTQMEDGGRQLNLREFLTKELLKRTTTSSSYSFSENSVASSILRSIIGSMTPSPQQEANAAGPCLDRHKTSTPMASQHSTYSGRAASKSNGGVSSIQLFSGESRLSSVHFNNSSQDVNQITGKDMVDAESKKNF